MRRSGRPTLQDVADLSGVSKGTVNRAIHNKPGINARTKERILEVIDELRFQPNYHARSLATGKTETIGVLLPNVDNEFFAMICSEIEEMCWQRGYVMNLSFSSDRPDREEAVIRSLVDRGVDGMIVFPVSNDQNVIRRAVDAGTPVVVLLNDLSLPDISAVVVNEYAAMAATVQHLIDRGHTTIAYINGYVHYSDTYNDYINRERFSAYADTLIANSLTPDPALTVEFDPGYYEEGDRYLLESLTGQKERPTAIVCFHDRIAIWVIQGLKRLGLQVPEEISVTGFDDIRELAYIHPRLTTTSIPTREVAAEALRVLFQLLEDPTEPPQRIVVTAQFIEGKSTALRGPGVKQVDRPIERG